jgi:predicted metalloprotease with PDZ domain
MRGCISTVALALALACDQPGSPADRRVSPPPREFDAVVATLSPTFTGIEYRMSPVLEHGELVALAIELRLRGDASGVTRIRLPEEWASERELWRYVRDVEVDGARAVAEDGPAVRVIHAEPGAALVLRYRVVSAFDRDPITTDGQPFVPIIRPQWFYAFGEALFAGPDGDDGDDRPARFVWTGAPPGYGFGSDLEQLGPTATVGDVRGSISIGGSAIHRYEQAIDDAILRVVVHGEYAFSHAAFVEMARTIIAAEREFWHEHGDPFTIVIAPLVPVPDTLSLGGTGRDDAFTIIVSANGDLAMMRHLIAHEYFHTWNAERIGGQADGDEEMVGKWFAEGFTEYYTWRLLLRSGQYQLEDFVEAWNENLQGYAVSPARNEPNARIVKDYWNDPAVGKLPYRRGSMLAVIWERQLRDATLGAKGLDDVMLAMRAKIVAAGDRKLAPDAARLFLATYVEQGGPDPSDVLERYSERGETIELAADVFGGCVRVVTDHAAGGKLVVQRLEIVGATTPDQRAACVRTVAGP